jgi:hypothetical protein
MELAGLCSHLSCLVTVGCVCCHFLVVAFTPAAAAAAAAVLCNQEQPAAAGTSVLCYSKEALCSSPVLALAQVLGFPQSH